MLPWESPLDCGDCAAKVGDLHSSGCDMEQCPECGWQLIGCGCYGQVEDLDGETIRPPCGEWPKDEIRIPWSGHHYGTAEIVEAGWFCKDENGKFHIPCDRSDPKAWPDLNRLSHMDWDKVKRRFVKR